MFSQVNGIMNYNDDGSSRLDIIKYEMNRGDEIILEADTNNKYDKNVVRVFVIIKGSKKQIGYLPSDIAKIVSPKLLNGENISAKLVAFGVYGYAPFCDLSITGI